MKLGTPWAIKKVLEILNLSGEIKEWFEYGGVPYRFKLFMKSIMSDPELWSKLASLVNEYKNERSWLDGIGIHREYTQNLFIGSALKNGKKYTIGLHFDLSIPQTSLYVGSVFRTAKKTSIDVHIPKVSIEQSTLYHGSAFRVARKITIGVANG
jgi:P2-related tail formation protein